MRSCKNVQSGMVKAEKVSRKTGSSRPYLRLTMIGVVTVVMLNCV
ncbi:MAG: hypothetical protein ABSG33_09160 [Candidatus Bathyarchaeia archaeon]